MAEKISLTGDSSTSVSKEENMQPSDQGAYLDSITFSPYLQKLPCLGTGYLTYTGYTRKNGNIFSYVINTPGMYTPGTLQSYKA